MTRVFCRGCATYLGEYHVTAIGAGRELREKIGDNCPKCGKPLSYKPGRMFFWQRGFWAWQKRREIPWIVLRSPIGAVGITGAIVLFDRNFLGPWLIGILGGLGIGAFIIIRERREEKAIAVRA